MNRHDIRAENSTLKRENRTLKDTIEKKNATINQMEADYQQLLQEMTQHVENGGKVFASENIPPGQLTVKMYSENQAVDLRTEGFIVGAESTRRAVEQLYNALQPILECTAAIHTAASCDNGPRTRWMIEQALNTLMSALENLDTVRKKTEQSDVAIIIYNQDVLKNIAAYTKDLRAHVKDYLVKETGEAQDTIRRFVAANNRHYAQLRDEINKISQSGRHKDEVRLLVGKMAFEYPKPVRGQTWKIGTYIYERLKDAQNETTEWRAMKLLQAMIEAEDNRALGVWVKDCQKLYHSSRGNDSLYSDSNKMG